MKAKKNSEPFFSASLPPEELEAILQQIDENLSTHPVLRDPMDTLPRNDLFTLPLPPEPPDFPALIAEIRNARAPYYVINGNLIAKTLKRLHNTVMRFFGRKQAYFNELTLNLLQAMATDLQSRQEHIRKQALLINMLSREVRAQREKITSLESEQSVSSRDTKPPKRAVVKKQRSRADR
jgi:hypothetical protein